MTLTIQEGVELAPLTTFKIGGRARYFSDVNEESALFEAVDFAADHGISLVVMSGGSNILVPDGDVNALYVRIVGDEYTLKNGILSAHAGCNLLSLIRECGARGLGGWEKLAGIPGTIGGAVRGNAGAFGPEIKDFVREVHAVHLDTREERVFQNAACEFSYRQSFFKRNPGWVIFRTVLELQPIDHAASAAACEETIAERERRHLQNVQAAGSFFMNPVAPDHVRVLFESDKGVAAREGRVPAGWLIEKAGLKGARVGGAVASMQHPNYLVNEGGATAQDVRNLAALIKQEVLNKFGIELHEEAALL